MIQRCKHCQATNHTHEFQDSRYKDKGPFARVFTECPRGAKDSGYSGRCTICGEKDTFTSPGN